MAYQLIEEDVFEELPLWEAASFDACLCDPPYGLEFMGKEWDKLDTRNYAAITPGNNSPHARRHSINYTGKPNPTCKKCGGLRGLNTEGSGGRHRCHCEKPDFPDYRTPAMKAMQAWHQRWAEAVYRVLKPGAFLLAFGGTRTHHRLMCALEDAGFEIRDTLMWLYGSGFPKSHDISKAIDKAAGAEREVVREGTPVRRMIPGADQDKTGSWIKDNGRLFIPTKTVPATDAAKQWNGYGTALKPAWEPIVVAMKPLDGTFAANALEHGVAGINVDGCRIQHKTVGSGNLADNPHLRESIKQTGSMFGCNQEGKTDVSGRWPANLVLSHHPDCVRRGVKKVKKGGGGGQASRDLKVEDNWFGCKDNAFSTSHYAADGTETVEDWECVEDCPVRMLDEQSGMLRARGNINATQRRKGSWFGAEGENGPVDSSDTGGASRFFYCAKASRKERNAGCEGLEEQDCNEFRVRKQNATRNDGGESPMKSMANSHPTVKPLALCKYLATLILPPKRIAAGSDTRDGGSSTARGNAGLYKDPVESQALSSIPLSRETVRPRRLLVPFAGSGSEMIGAMQAGWDEIVGIEMESEYCRIAQARLDYWANRERQVMLFD